MEIRRNVASSAFWICDCHRVHAQDSAKDFEQYEKFVGAMTKILEEGRREGARRFYIAGDLNVEVGLMPQCWYGVDADPGGFSKDDVARSHERVRLQVFFLVDL